MRIRAVRPDFWSDETLGSLSDATRLFYIGLWCIADDAGWLEWRPAQIGATLYPYKPAGRRTRDITTWGTILVSTGRLVLHPCGCGVIPTLVKHQKQVGNPSYQYRDKHRRNHNESQLVPSDIPQEVGKVKVGKVKGSNGASASSNVDKSDEDWDSKIIEMQRHGEQR